MEIDKINNLLELFFIQYKKQDKNNIFLNSLKDQSKKYSWEDTFTNVLKLSNEISKYINKGDRCLIISENRPEWLITDLSIMMAYGITVPAYTTYTENDYKYLIEDCEPSIVVISNNEMHKKLQKIIREKDFIKKIITFEKIEGVDYKNKYLDFNSIIENDLQENDKIENLNLKRNSPACIIYTS